jgi:transcriptional regulator with XRE-family HTH domain
MDIKEIFGQRVKSLRIEKGLSQEALSYKANIDRTYMPGIESGKRNVSLVIIEKLANALEVDIKELFNVEMR